MTTSLLETDKALQELLKELKQIKGASQQLEDAGRTVSQVVQSAELVVELSAKVLDGSAEQTEAVTRLADEVETKLQAELLPQLEACRRTASVNRWLLIILFVALAANLALTYLNYQLLLSR